MIQIKLKIRVIYGSFLVLFHWASKWCSYHSWYCWSQLQGDPLELSGWVSELAPRCLHPFCVIIERNMYRKKRSKSFQNVYLARYFKDKSIIQAARLVQKPRFPRLLVSWDVLALPREYHCRRMVRKPNSARGQDHFLFDWRGVLYM